MIHPMADTRYRTQLRAENPKVKNKLKQNPSYIPEAIWFCFFSSSVRRPFSGSPILAVFELFPSVVVSVPPGFGDADDMISL